MSSTSLQDLLKTVARVSQPFKSLDKESQSLSADIQNTQQALAMLNAQASKIKDFRNASKELKEVGRQLKISQQAASDQARSFKNSVAPTREQTEAMNSARASAASLQLRYNQQREALQRQRQELKQAGISTRTLSSDDRRLRESIGDTTTHLNNQQEQLARVNAQKEKVTRRQERFQRGKELGGRVSAAGSAGIKTATTIFDTGSKLLEPGYELAQQNSELQATLGLDKQSPDLQALKQQARSMGSNGGAYATPADVTATQNLLAQSGASAGAILTQTPAVLNLSRGNNQSPGDNATLLRSTQSAFGLGNDSSAHVADVIAATMEQSKLTFADLNASLTGVSSVASSAGLSLEQTSAMIGSLHDASITGAAAGTGASTVIGRLQTPDTKALSAMQSLGVKTTDEAGNSQSVISLLQQIQQGFAQKNLSSGQRENYINVIFGKQGAPAATALMGDAASGRLGQLTDVASQSDGTAGKLAAARQDNLAGDVSRLKGALQSLSATGFDQQEGSLRNLTQTATGYLLSLDTWLQKNQGIVQTLGTIASASTLVSGGLGIIGSVLGPVISGISMLAPIFVAIGEAIAVVIGGISLPVVAAVALIVGGALLIWKYWEPISGFFSDIGQKVSGTFEQLKPVFGWLGEKVQAAVQWFKDLLAPVKSTQEGLDSCRNASMSLGDTLANIVQASIDTFKKLGKGVDWVKGKLTFGSKTSPDPEASSADATATPPNGAPLSAAAPIAGYRAITPPAGRSYIDQSKSDYNLTIAANAASDPLLMQKIREQLELFELDKQARQRSAMTYAF